MTQLVAPAAAGGTMQIPGDLISLASWPAGAIARVLDLALAIKADPLSHAHALAGVSGVMLFEKPSLRTRVSFEVGLAKLGGHAVYLDHNAGKLGVREPVSDYASNLSQWCDVIIARTDVHAIIEDLAASATVPVINALSDLCHPCQALADVLTLAEVRGGLEDCSVAYIGDGNNVCHSLMIACAKLGIGITVICPAGHGPSPVMVAEAKRAAAGSGGSVAVTTDPEAVAGHDAVYTDKWVSMGATTHGAALAETFAPYRVTPALMELAGPSAVFMHCLPAKRGEEVVAEVIDGPASVVLQQAQNRMHAQNGLMVALLGGGNG